MRSLRKLFSTGQSKREDEVSNEPQTTDVPQDLSRFQYRELEDPRQWIRLLKVLNYHENRRVRFSCSIEHTFLMTDADHADYVALSYTWGHPFATSQCAELYGAENSDIYIHVKDTCSQATGFLKITRNLAEALQSWSLNEDYKASLVWIDQICIDQENIPEREKQVSSMGEVYARSRATVAWLGMISQDDDHLFEAQHKVYESLASYEAMHGKINPNQLTLVGENVVIPALGFGMHHSYIEGFYGFLQSCRYMARVWIVQEIALAKKTTFMIGQRIFSKEEMIWLIYFWLRFPMLHEFHLPNTGNTEKISSSEIGTISAMAQEQRNGGLRNTARQGYLHKVHGAELTSRLSQCFAYFEHLLSLTLHCRATDPRDHFYGILGLVNPYLPNTTERNSLLPLDYTSPSEDVFTKVTIMLLDNLPFLNILSFVPDRSQRSNRSLPSWVPEFNALEQGQRPFQFIRAACGPYQMFCSWPIVDSSRRTHTVSGSKLVLSGAFVDTVSSCSRESPIESSVSPQTRFEVSADTMIYLLDTCYELGPKYRDDKDVVEAAAETLTFNRSGNLSAQQLVSQFHATLQLNALSALSQDISFEMSTVDRYLTGLERLCGIAGFPSTSEVERVKELVQFFRQLPYSQYREESDKCTREWSKELELSNQFHAASRDTGNMRKLFRSEHGFIGRLPNSVEKGDEVWILNPARVPCILRPTGIDDEYILMGSAYVHGIMFGEFITEQTKKFGSVEKFSRKVVLV